MSRRARGGGGSSRRPGAAKKTRPRRASPEALDSDAIDPGAPEYAAVDWEALEPADFELDPLLVERIRSRSRLRQITIRIGEEQIAEARRVAAETGIPYQTILRRWIARGASLSRAARKTKSKKAR